jgi:hypothetical protein
MIIRVGLFITLLAVFYFYCTEDTNSSQFNAPNDINMIETPIEISPSLMEKSNTHFTNQNDSIYFLSSGYSSTVQPTIDFTALTSKKY